MVWTSFFVNYMLKKVRNLPMYIVQCETKLKSVSPSDILIRDHPNTRRESIELDSTDAPK